MEQIEVLELYNAACADFDSALAEQEAARVAHDGNRFEVACDTLARVELAIHLYGAEAGLQPIM